MSKGPVAMPFVDKMRYALTHTADYFVANQTFDPLNVRGYGIVDALAAAQSAPPRTGDLDEDGAVGIVGITDLLELLSNWD